MDSSALIGAVAVIGVIVVISLFRMGVLGKARLPALPEAGPLPVMDLPKYFDLSEPAIAWERARAWDLNQAPPNWNAPAPVDHLILTQRLLDFCSGASGKLVLSFNFLVEAIENVEFDPNALAPGGNQGLLTVYTPSGRTFAVTTTAFAQALQQAVANTR
jgi:hypothetical protein